MHDEDKDITYINERNRKLNEKIDRSYSKVRLDYSFMISDAFDQYSVFGRLFRLHQNFVAFLKRFGLRFFCGGRRDFWRSTRFDRLSNVHQNPIPRTRGA